MPVRRLLTGGGWPGHNRGAAGVEDRWDWRGGVNKWTGGKAKQVLAALMRIGWAVKRQFGSRLVRRQLELLNVQDEDSGHDDSSPNLMRSKKRTAAAF